LINTVANDEVPHCFHCADGVLGKLRRNLGCRTVAPLDVEAIESSTETTNVPDGVLASDESEHALEFLQLDAERCCRQKEDTFRDSVELLQSLTEVRVAAFGSVRLVHDEQGASQVFSARCVVVGCNLDYTAAEIAHLSQLDSLWSHVEVGSASLKNSTVQKQLIFPAAAH
jgi:hypothetical protein